MDDAEIARIARAAGLVRFLEEHPNDLAAALRGAADLARRLPRELDVTEESAHVLALPIDAEDRR